MNRMKLNKIKDKEKREKQTRKKRGKYCKVNFNPDGSYKLSRRSGKARYDSYYSTANTIERSCKQLYDITGARVSLQIRPTWPFGKEHTYISPGYGRSEEEDNNSPVRTPSSISSPTRSQASVTSSPGTPSSPAGPSTPTKSPRKRLTKQMSKQEKKIRQSEEGKKGKPQKICAGSADVRDAKSIIMVAMC